MIIQVALAPACLQFYSMEQQLKDYEFVNSETGNVIAYFTLREDLRSRTNMQLENKRAEMATGHKMLYQLISWPNKKHPTL